MIEEMAKDRNNVESRVKEAYEKAQALQDKLNAVITFVDPEAPERNCLYQIYPEVPMPHLNLQLFSFLKLSDSDRHTQV